VKTPCCDDLTLHDIDKIKASFAFGPIQYYTYPQF